MSRYVATEKAFNNGHPFESMLSGRNGWIGVGEESAPLREGNLYVYHSRDRVTSRVSRYVYRVRGRGVGVMLIVQLVGKAPIITTVFVRASHRRRGIATKLHVRAAGLPRCGARKLHRVWCRVLQRSLSGVGMKHTVMAWNFRRILVAVVECKVVRPAVVLPVEAAAALNELRAQLGHRKGDSRWDHWRGASEVGVCPNTTVVRKGG